MLDIPAVTRYLAHHLQVDAAKRPPEDFAFLLSMDAGNHPSHPTGTARHYLADWWNKDFRPRPIDILNIDNLFKCLKYHRDEEQSSLRPTAKADSQRAERQLGPGIVEMPCPRCVLYRGAAMDELHDLHEIRNLLQASEAIQENQRLLTGRRAVAFNTLYEKALFKEAEDPSAGNVAVFTAQPAPPPAPTPEATPAPSGPNPARRSRKPATVPAPPNIPKTLTLAQLAEVVRENSNTQWKRLQQHLEQHGALKWTWGVDIQDDEIKHMFRAAERNFQPHTGYNCSLGGPIPGESTVIPVLPTPSERDCHTGADVPDVPELGDAAIPTHFNDYPLRRLRERIPSQKLPMVPMNYVPQGADADEPPVAGTLRSLTDVSMLHVQAAQAMRAQERSVNVTDAMPVTLNSFSAAAALEALGCEGLTFEPITMPLDALMALEDDNLGAKETDLFEPEDQSWTEHLTTNISVREALEALQAEYEEPDAQSIVVQDVSGADALQALQDDPSGAVDIFKVQDVSGADALQALQDDSSGADDVLDPQPIVIEDSDEDSLGANNVLDNQLIVIEDSDASLDYIDPGEHRASSFRQLATEDDPLAEQNVMITEPATAAEALEALDDVNAGHRPSAQQMMASTWTAADFQHCVTPDDFDSDESE